MAGVGQCWASEKRKVFVNNRVQIGAMANLSELELELDLRDGRLLVLGGADDELSLFSAN